MPGPTATTRVLISFGARRGGFEFAMALRQEIYAKFGRKPDADPGFCYIDAESLRGDANTTYNRDAKVDMNFMRNPNWDSHYESAMSNCRTMILMITREWLSSPFCWHELGMLQRIAAKKNGMLKVVLVVWPDAQGLLQGGAFTDRDGKPRSGRDLWKSFFTLPGATSIHVSGGSAPGSALIESTGGVNEFSYACTEGECQQILRAVVV